LTINDQTPRQQLRAIGFEALIEHYREHEMPDIFFKNNVARPDEAAAMKCGNRIRRNMFTRAI
jgi:hypothetical protein